MPEYKLFSKNQHIETGINGAISLLNYHAFAKKYRNCWITLNFDGINFIDANLSALLYGIIFDLKKNYDVKTFVDFKSIGRDLNVLSRNGLTYFIGGKDFRFSPVDMKDTTIPLMMFDQADVDEYCNYIERDFLHHRGLDCIKFNDKERIVSSYLEIFDNVGLHANTLDPIFVCGQYFPILKEVKFTLVDLGDGFLQKIKEYTKGTDNIINASDAINWAIKGNTTKVGVKGGTGLKDIFWFCQKTGGSLHIMSDDCYYSLTNQKVMSYRLPNPFKGATIHLIFRYLM